MQKCYLLLFLVLSGFAENLNGQSISGQAIDTLTGKPVTDATVTLLSAKDSSLISFTMTDAQGRFDLPKLPVGEYRLLISHVNYHSLARKVNLTKDAPEAVLGPIRLSDRSLLGEVTVSAEIPPVTMIGDTVQYHADAFHTPPNASVEQLLKKLPGVQVDKDGTIKSQGQAVKRVLVDGKEFFGNDPKMATKNLPADAVADVQFYEKQTDQAALTGFDDGNSEKTINLKLKHDKKKGGFGKLSAGAGTGGRFEGRANLNSFKGPRQMSVIGAANNTNTEAFSFMDLLNFTGDMSRLMRGGAGTSESLSALAGSGSNNQGIRSIRGGGINYNNRIGNHTDFTSNYFYNQYEPEVRTELQRSYLLPDSGYHYQASSLSNNSTGTHRLNLGFDSQLDSFNSLKVTPTVAWQDARTRAASQYRQYGENGSAAGQGADGELSNLGTSNNTFHNRGVNFRNEILYGKKFRRKGRSFSLDLQTTINNSNGDGTQQSVNEYYSPGAILNRRDSIDQQLRSSADQLGYNARAVYTEPISRRSLLELSVARSSTTSKADQRTWDYDAADGKYSRVNDSLSNHFENTYSYLTGGLRFRNQRRKLKYSIGVNWQRAVLEGKLTSGIKDSVLRKTFNDLLPVARFQYNFTRYKNLQVNYSTATNQPTISQLQPVPDISDPLNIREGNPALHQEYRHDLHLNYAGVNPFRNRNLFAGFTLSRVDDKIVNSDSVFSNGIKKTRPVNVDAVYSVSGDITFGLPLHALKGTVQAGSRLGYDRGKQFINGSPNTIDNWSAGPRVSFNGSPTESLDYSVGAELNFNHTSYSLRPSFNTNYLSQVYSADLNWELPHNFHLQTDLNYTLNRQLAAGFNTSVPLWNASVGHLLGKSKRAELKLRVNDLLNRNIGVSRSSNQNFIEDSRVNTLKRYGLLSFTYSLSKVGLGGKVQMIRFD